MTGFDGLFCISCYSGLLYKILFNIRVSEDGFQEAETSDNNNMLYNNPEENIHLILNNRFKAVKLDVRSTVYIWHCVSSYLFNSTWLPFFFVVYQVWRYLRVKTLFWEIIKGCIPTLIYVYITANNRMICSWCTMLITYTKVQNW